MKKKVLSLIVLAAILINFIPITAKAYNGLSNFIPINTYKIGQFSDVPSTAWFSKNVATAYELGLMVGNSDTYFNSSGSVTIAEAITVSARIHSIYTNGEAEFAPSSPWYRTFVDYALINGIIKREYADYTVKATRADFASILRAALPPEELTVINEIDDGAIPDVNKDTGYANDVYILYRAGILTGNDAKGTFTPESYISRSAAASIITRMVDTGLRQTVTLSAALSATAVFETCSPAVFYIQVYDNNGNPFASGSGFFISASGLAITNYHVLEECCSAKIKTSTGEVYDVLGVYDYSVENDVAILQIDGSGFPYLKTADSSIIKTGETVYAIGSPLGLDNTISEGIISSSNRVINGNSYIQVTASISHGSSGGALLDTTGNVIGITTAYLADGQNLNLALPISIISSLNMDNLVSLSTVYEQTNDWVFYASSSQVTLYQGEDTVITLYDTGLKTAGVEYYVADTSIVSCSWGDWDESYESIPLTVTGLAAGTTVITLNSYDENDNQLASFIINVTVNQSASSQYYSSHFPTPDFGAFTSTPVYYTYTNPTTGTSSYYYRISDIKVDPEMVVYGYGDLLQNNGFYYSNSFDGPDGEPVTVYENDLYDEMVYFSVVELYSVPCVLIMAAFS